MPPLPPSGWGLVAGRLAPDGTVGAAVGRSWQGRRASVVGTVSPAGRRRHRGSGAPVLTGGLKRGLRHPGLGAAACRALETREGLDRGRTECTEGRNPEVMPLSRPRSASIRVKLLLGMTQPPPAPLMNLGWGCMRVPKLGQMTASERSVCSFSTDWWMCHGDCLWFRNSAFSVMSLESVIIS